MNIIQFDNNFFVNYEGLKSIDKSDSVERAFEKLLNQNRVEEVGLGHIFIDQQVTVIDEYFRFKKLNIGKRISPIKYFIKARRHRFFSPNNDLNFTGFFRIENLSNLAADYSKPGYWLTLSEQSYVDEKKLPYSTKFRLFSKDVDKDAQNIGYFLNKKNSLKTNEPEQLVNLLYFQLSDISLHVNEKTQTQLENFKKIKPDAIFVDGICVSKKNTTVIDESKLPTRALLAITVAGLMQVLMNKDKPAFDKKSDIYKHLTDEFQGLEGLKENSIKKYIRNATDYLEENQEPPSYKDRFFIK